MITNDTLATNKYSVPYVSRITDDDQALLELTQQKFRPQSYYYEDSWGYILQSTRYGGFKWYDPTNGSLIFFGKKSMSDDTLVVPCFFAEPEYLIYVLKKICNNRAILKNINKIDTNKFLSLGFREYNELEAWDNFTKYDDQTYPQSIVDLKLVTELKGKIYHHLRKTLRKEIHAAIYKYNDEYYNDVLNIFAMKDGYTFYDKEKIHGMYYSSHEMYVTANIDKYVIIDILSNNVLGFTAISRISNDNAAFVALLFKPTIKYASVWGIYKTLEETYKRGYKTVNFGGSESEGTDTFVKRNFHPILQIEKVHLIFEL